jgi:hypothetical protein
MAEDAKFGDGYEAIFGKKKPVGKPARKAVAKRVAVKKPAAAKPSGKTK